MTLGISVDEIVEKSNNPLLGIHVSWQRVRLESIAVILNGCAFESSRFTKSEGIPLLRIRDIGKNSTEAFYSGPYDKAYLIKPGELVIGMDGDFNCAEWRGPQALLNQRVCKVTVTSTSYNSKFLEFVLPGYLKAINDSTSSVTVKHLSSKTVGEIPLPLPPLPEQERIVARLEELLSDLEAGVAALERVRAGVKRYKASVLKAACNGNILGEKGIENSETGLPKGWRRGTVEQLAKREKNSIKRGPFGSAVKKAYFVPKGYKIYEQQNVIQNDFALGSYYIDAQRFELLKGFQIFPGDLLITGAGTIGKVAIVPENIEPGIMNQALLKISLEPNLIDTQFFIIWFKTRLYDYLIAQSRGSAMKNISSVKDLKNMEFALPPLEEQQRIVMEVERRLELAREVESAVEAGLKRAKRLRQAVLRSAFEGRL